MKTPKEYTLARTTDEREIIEGWAMPALGDFLNLPADAVGTAGGAMEVRQSKAFKLIDAKDANNVAQVLSVEVIIRRNAADDNEVARVDTALAEMSKRQTASKLKRADESEKTVSATLTSFRHGLLTQAEIAAKAAAEVDTASKVEEALKLAAIVAAIHTPKSLPSTQ